MIKQSSTVVDFDRNPEIFSKRRRLLIFLSIGLVLTVIGAVGKFIPDDSKTSASSILRNAMEPQNKPVYVYIVTYILSVIYFVGFIIVVKKYHRTGIIVFTWLTVIEMIEIPLITIVGIHEMSKLSSTVDDGAKISMAIVSLIIAMIITAILFIIIIITSFKLAKLMKTPNIHPIV